MIWAAARNRLETAEWLIEHGASVDLKATFGGPTHAQEVTALPMASQTGHLLMVRLLIEKERIRRSKMIYITGTRRGGRGQLLWSD